MKRILVVEPYWGGSHRLFIEGLIANTDASYFLLTLPARSWKGKMQLSAAWCVAELEKIPADQRVFDLVLCSTFVDLSVFRAVLSRKKWWQLQTPFYLYFHENQVAYPSRMAGTDGHQFALINFNSALASDSIAFNSEYNRRTFLAGCRRYLQKMQELDLDWTVAEIQRKSRILYPPVEFSHIDLASTKRPVDVPVVVWNHRWEHDKGVSTFFLILNELKNAGVDFRLLLLGQAHPDAADYQRDMRRAFADKIVHYGYVSSPIEYHQLLGRGDIVVSTATHEFFGIAVAEAVRAGCVPVLPDDLAYRELYPREYLYKEGQCLAMLISRLREKKRLQQCEAVKLTAGFSWQVLRGDYERWLEI